MKPQQLHHKHIPVAILGTVDPETFAPTRLTAKALSEDSCWEEEEADFEASLPGYELCAIEDDY